MSAKHVADEPLEPISLHGFLRGTLGNRQPESRIVLFIGVCKDGEVLIGRALGAAEDAAELRRSSQPASAGKTLRRVAADGSATRRYGASRARPLARRRLKTCRPFFVAMRARKPWVLLRLRLLG